MVAYVHSHISGVEKRQETRATWASRWAEDLGVRLATVFMVGRARTEREEEIVKRESMLYGDIVQVRERERDSYTHNEREGGEGDSYTHNVSN